MRCCALLVIALMLLFTPAFAAVYQCEDSEGNLFLTDDPEKFPPGCEQVGEPIVGPEEEATGGSEPQEQPTQAGETPAEQAETPEEDETEPPPSPQTPVPRAGEEGPGTSPEDVRERLSEEMGQAPAFTEERAEPEPSQEPQPLYPGDDVMDEEPDDDRPDDVPGGDNAFEEAPPPGETYRGADGSSDVRVWEAEARRLAREYDRIRKAAGPQQDVATRLERLEARIQSFLDRLSTTELTEEEQAQVEAALPPPPE